MLQNEMNLMHIKRPTGPEQKLWVEARNAEIQQVYENLETDRDLKLLFMAAGVYYA